MSRPFQVEVVQNSQTGLPEWAIVNGQEPQLAQASSQQPSLAVVAADDPKQNEILDAEATVLSPVKVVNIQGQLLDQDQEAVEEQLREILKAEEEEEAQILKEAEELTTEE